MKTLLIALLLAAAPKAPAVIDAADYGVTTAPGVDASVKLQALLDSVPGNVVVRLGPGVHYAGQTVRIEKDNVTIEGAGTSQTEWLCAGRQAGFAAGSFADRAADGFVFSEGGRPDLFGFADASLAPRPGAARGFDTRSRTVLSSTAGPLHLGASTDAGWDYLAGKGGFTVECLLRGTYPPGQGLFGWGSPADPVGPGVAFVNSQTPQALTVSIAFEDDPPGVSHAVTFAGVDWSKDVRLRYWYDPKAGALGAWCNGRDLAGTWYGTPPRLTGRVPRKNRKGYPFLFGTPATEVTTDPVPPSACGGFRLSAAPRKADPGTDLLRYATDDADTVAFLDVAAAPSGRLVAVRGGRAGGGVPGQAVACDVKAPADPVGRPTVRDLFVNGGSPGVLLYQVFTARLDRARFANGRAGLGCVRYGVNYPINANGCEFGGDDAAVDLYNAFGTGVANQFVMGGVTSIRQTGAGMNWYGNFVNGLGPAPETAVDLWGGGGFAANDVFDGMIVDNETVSFSDSIFRVENAPYTPRSTFIRGGFGGPGRYAFHLISGASDLYKTARFDVAGFVIPTNIKGAVYAEGAAKWTGEVDTRGCVPPLGPSGGSGLDPSKLVIKAPGQGKP